MFEIYEKYWVELFWSKLIGLEGIYLERERALGEFLIRLRLISDAEVWPEINWLKLVSDKCKLNNDRFKDITSLSIGVNCTSVHFYVRLWNVTTTQCI